MTDATNELPEMVMVPRVPTPEMLAAAPIYDGDMIDRSDDESDDAWRVWSAMLAAAPSTPTASSDGLREALERQGCFDNGPTEWVRVEDVIAAFATEAAQPAAGVGEGVCEECGGNGYAGGVMPAHEEMRGEYDAACTTCLGTGKAPTPPTTDEARSVEAIEVERATERVIRAIPAHSNRDWIADPIQETEREWARALAGAALASTHPSGTAQAGGVERLRQAVDGWFLADRDIRGRWQIRHHGKHVDYVECDQRDDAYERMVALRWEQVLTVSPQPPNADMQSVERAAKRLRKFSSVYASTKAGQADIAEVLAALHSGREG